MPPCSIQASLWSSILNVARSSTRIVGNEQATTAADKGNCDCDCDCIPQIAADGRIGLRLICVWFRLFQGKFGVRLVCSDKIMQCISLFRDCQHRPEVCGSISPVSECSLAGLSFSRMYESSKTCYFESRWPFLNRKRIA